MSDDVYSGYRLVGLLPLTVRNILNYELAVTVVLILGVLLHARKGDAAGGQRVDQRLQGEAHLEGKK
jgi:hypothetical protein